MVVLFTCSSIKSSLLLTSDLKGYMEDPGYYFIHPSQLPKLDLVMLTQGWSCFDVLSALRNKKNHNELSYRKGQTISGKVSNWLGRNAKNGRIIGLSPKSNMFKTTTADDSGRFIVDGLAFADSTTFQLKALSKNGRANVDIQLDKDLFPSHLQFFSKDVHGTYTVIIEGITTHGEPIHREAKLSVEWAFPLKAPCFPVHSLTDSVL